jgi:preprotein translocase subunit SecD
LSVTLLAALAGQSGCRTRGKNDIEATTLRLHIQTIPDALEHHITAVVGRRGSFQVVVDEDAFLSEIFVSEATLIDVVGGYEIKVTFDPKGTRILEQFTTAHKSKRIAVYSQFGASRWLAAPVIRRRIADGVFAFTPDCTREEAERIVRGLMNVAGEVRKKYGS